MPRLTSIYAKWARLPAHISWPCVRTYYGAAHEIKLSLNRVLGLAGGNQRGLETSFRSCAVPVCCRLPPYLHGRCRGTFGQSKRRNGHRAWGSLVAAEHGFPAWAEMSRNIIPEAARHGYRNRYYCSGSSPGSCQSTCQSTDGTGKKSLRNARFGIYGIPSNPLPPSITMTLCMPALLLSAVLAAVYLQALSAAPPR